MPLPLRSFAWMSEEEIANFDVMRDVSMETGPGYILEVTLRYDQSLHLEHNSFPLAPEHIEVTEADLSPYALNCLQELNSGNRARKYRAQKLSSTFRDRVKYVCHGLNLQLYVQLGMELVTIHRGIKFHQEPYFKPYIAMCTKKRAQAKTKSESNIYKFLSNSLYGKLIEGVKNRLDCHFNMSERKALKNFSDPLYKGLVICSEDFSVSFHHKREVWMRQSWASGFTVLELSKYYMQHLFYNCVKPSLGGRASVCMSDTDSWVLAAPGHTPDEIVNKLKEWMDFSNYEPTHPLYDPSRKNLVGYLKNEISKDVVLEFVGLRSKTYALKTEKEEVESKAKGVKRCYKKKLSFEAYKKCLDTIASESVKQVSIMSKNHQNLLIQSERVAFSSFDDKRYLLCAYHSCPYNSRLIDMLHQTNKCYFCENPDVLV